MRKKIGSSLIICLLLTTIVMIICYSKEVMESVTFSISIWKDNLFPSLFPFFIVSNLLLEYGFVSYVSSLFKRIMSKFFHLPKESSFALIISLFSGFPSGAKYTTELVKNDVLTKEEGARLLTFTHYSNPLFILGMIGSILLGNKKQAFIILFSHIISSFIIGIILRPKTIPRDNELKNYLSNSKEIPPFGKALRNSIFDALETMFLLLGIVTVFLIITTIIDIILPLTPTIKVIISGLLEMTQGVKLASELTCTPLIKAMFMTFFISFGGLSVHAQVLSIISEAKIKYKYFFIARILHAILATILVFIIYHII